MKWTDLEENWCPVARTLTLVGDRWTLLILRDCFLGFSKFEEFAENTGATRHIISSRLKRLVEAGILERRPYQSRPVRHAYVLTEKGREFGPALAAFRDWGKKHLPVRRAAAPATE
ncbi:helix-turn-helix domain-containing protein [Henriciella sp.]|uniref:winged helix-turn-helix transcriptional regulator n=1 Tax=Henriciella sp. TaxID=1968823 RepID=UPI002617D6E5|nr:helix-turn-helix domain-containing protein [Henriciella sp.]